MTSGQKPRAFRITPERDVEPDVATTPLAARPPQARIVEEPFEIVDAADGVAVPVAPRRRSPWGRCSCRRSAPWSRWGSACPSSG